MRDILLAFDEDISETFKYGMPCFKFKKKMFCYLWQDKKTKNPYFLIVDGNLIEHPALEAGKRARMKTLSVNPNEDLPIEIIQEVLTLAIKTIQKV